MLDINNLRIGNYVATKSNKFGQVVGLNYTFNYTDNGDSIDSQNEMLTLDCNLDSNNAVLHFTDERWRMNLVNIYDINTGAVKPISLTDDWFIALGLSKIAGDTWEFNRDLVTMRILKSESGFYSVEFSYGLSGIVENSLTYVDYVHELQNLYYSQTGKELNTVINIKSKPDVKPFVPGSRFYDVSVAGIIQYEYYGIMNNRRGKPDKNYHILIDLRTYDPIRMHITTLQQIYDKGINSREDANTVYIKELERKLDKLKLRL